LLLNRFNQPGDKKIKPRKTFKQAIFLANREKESHLRLEQKIPLHPGLIVQNYSKEEFVSPKI
jgi:hypothetical protein